MVFEGNKEESMSFYILTKLFEKILGTKFSNFTCLKKINMPNIFRDLSWLIFKTWDKYYWDLGIKPSVDITGCQKVNREPNNGGKIPEIIFAQGNSMSCFLELMFSLTHQIICFDCRSLLASFILTQRERATAQHKEFHSRDLLSISYCYTNFPWELQQNSFYLFPVRQHLWTIT